jgi:hypothetical protein
VSEHQIREREGVPGGARARELRRSLAAALASGPAARDASASGSEPRRRARLLTGLATNLISLVAFCLVAFSLNEAYLLWNMDGLHFKVMAQKQVTWLPHLLGYSANPLESLGNVWYPLNMALEPGFLLARDPVTAELDVVLCYTLLSLELFCSTWLLATSLGLGGFVAALAGWLLLLLAMPLWGLPFLFPMYAMAPNYPISQSLLVLVLFRQIGRARAGASLLALAAILARLVAGPGMDLGPILLANVGVLLFAVATLSIYLARIHKDTVRRPLFIVDERNSHLNRPSVDDTGAAAAPGPHPGS